MIEILDKKDCCGCTACESICGVRAITMKPDIEGFLYPEVNRDLCVDCTMCEKVCPITFRDNKPKLNFPHKVFALHNKDLSVWKSCSSGGLFAELALMTVHKGGIVYGAEYNDDFVVIHRGETTEEGVLKFRGSKYVQSDMRNVYREVRENLRSEKMVLFSGVPCQVEGLKCYLRKPFDNLLTVDILCHGVPSPKIFADYIDFIKKYSVGKLTAINMKDKTFGWGYQNLKLFFGKKYSQFNTPVSNLWNKIFYDHAVNRPSCHSCRFTNYNRPGDLTIGDYWGIEKTHPEFASESGISLLMVNTNAGENVWNDIKERFEYVQTPTEACLQPSLCRSQFQASDRDSLWEEYRRKGFPRTFCGRFGISRNSLIVSSIRQSINYFLNCAR